MFATCRLRMLFGLAGFVAAMLVTQQSVQGQKKVAIPFGVTAKDKEKDEPRTDEFSFNIDDKRAPKIIESVLKHLKPELPPDEWKDIITNLQALLDDPSDRLVEWTDPLSKDRRPKKTSIRIVANLLIGRFSKQGRDFYQREFGPTADQKLKDATQRGDMQLLSDVSYRYFHTKAGAEATILLARFQLDRGHYNTAAATFRRFLDRNADDPVPVNVSFLAALACKRLAIGAAARNDKVEKDQYLKYASDLWEKVQKEVGNNEVPFGPKKVRLEQLKAEFDRPIATPVVFNQSERFRPFGDNRNNAQGVGGRPFLDPSWECSMTPIFNKEDQDKKGAAMNWIKENVESSMKLFQQMPNNPPLPMFFPVASAGKIIFRTYDGVYCFATRDDPSQNPPVKAGEMLWMNECENCLFKMVENTHGRSRMDAEWKRPYFGQGPKGIFFEHGLNGSISHDGTLAYYVDDMAVPPHPQLQIQQFGGFPGQPVAFAPAYQDQVMHNKLAALNIETGKLEWKLGLRDPNRKSAPPPGSEEKETAASLLSDAFFLGAPMPLGGKLYVVIEKERELRLVCLDPSKARQPELVWWQPLGVPFVELPRDTLRRIQGIHLAYSDNVLVVPTNAGAVLGIDLLSHSLIWARSYRQANHVASDLPMQPFGGRRPFNPQPNQVVPNLNADRWRTSTPIISGSRVVFTAYDSNSLLCLNLRDGEILWEIARNSDDLYVGGVIDNKVLVVGKSSVKFIDVNKGTQVGQAITGTPSGVGTASDDVYFLPIKPSRDNPDPEILSIDVKKMEVSAHTRSRKKIVAGNLMFFDGAIFSQTATALTAFPQLSIKKAEAQKRLATNQNDPIGLAENGDLELDDGHLKEAIDLYNRCLANKPNDETRFKAREKLYDAITEQLQRDFNSGEKLLDQYKELCAVERDPKDDPLRQQQKAEEELRRKSNYFCLLAKGKESQGKLVEAFENYMSFGTLAGNKDLVSVIDQPNTYASPPVWVRGRIGHMFDKATPEQRKPLEEKAARQWAEIKKADELERIRAFVDVFGNRFAAGNEARLTLAEKLIATNNEEDLRDAENILLGLRVLDEEKETFAAQATEILARLYIRKGLFDDAMGLYGELNRRFPKVVIRDQKTGSDFFNELITDKRFLPFLEPLRQTWVHRKLKAQEVPSWQGNQVPQSFTISPEGESIPFYNRYKIVMDMMTQGNASWQFKVIDRVTGEERFRSQPMTPPQYIWQVQPPTNNHRFAQIRGHLLIVNLNQMVYAYDLADRKKLWEYNLFGKTPMPTDPPRYEAEADGVRIYYQDGWSQKAGQVGVIESSYVCLITRDGLVALDPSRGTVLWTKSNVSSRVQLMGDANHVFIFESNAEGGITSARAVRAGDGVEIQIQDASQLFSSLKRSKSVGRRILAHEEKGDKKSMRLYDILTGKDDWTKEISGSAVMLQCDDPNLTGFVTDKGEVAVFSVKDGKEIFSSKLDSKKLAQHMDKVESAVLLVDRERFFVVLNRPVENNVNFGFGPSVTPGIRMLRVNGPIYCFDRATRKRLWFTEELFDNQQIVLDQFQDVPIVLGAHLHNRINNGIFEGNALKIVAIDKRTGVCLFKKEVQQNQPFHALHVDPRAGTIEFIRGDMRVKFSPDDGKATSALPGVPVGANIPQPVPGPRPIAVPVRVLIK